MSAGTRLIHRMFIERNFAVRGEADSTDPKPDWRANPDALHCYYFVTGGNEAVSAERTVVVQQQRVLVSFGADVRETDRIAHIKDRRGRIVAAGPMNIRAALRKRTHRMLLVESAA